MGIYFLNSRGDLMNIFFCRLYHIKLLTKGSVTVQYYSIVHCDVRCIVFFFCKTKNMFAHAFESCLRLRRMCM